jgi:hypothetical protein
MRASILYRIAAVLLLLFAVGHTLGFRQSDPAWGVDALLGSMRSGIKKYPALERAFTSQRIRPSACWDRRPR